MNKKEVVFYVGISSVSIKWTEILSALEDKIRIPNRPCNILYVFNMFLIKFVSPHGHVISSVFNILIKQLHVHVCFLSQYSAESVQYTDNSSVSEQVF